MTLKEKIKDEIDNSKKIIGDKHDNSDYADGIKYGIEFLSENIEKVLNDYKEDNQLEKELQILLNRHKKVIKRDNLSDMYKDTIVILDNEIEKLLKK